MCIQWNLFQLNHLRSMYLPILPGQAATFHLWGRSAKTKKGHDIISVKLISGHSLVDELMGLSVISKE